jgi:hypothetical protein
MMPVSHVPPPPDAASRVLIVFKYFRLEFTAMSSRFPFAGTFINNTALAFMGQSTFTASDKDIRG